MSASSASSPAITAVSTSAGTGSARPPSGTPVYFYEAEAQLLLDLVADMIERITVYNDQLPLLPEGITRFHSRAPPGISVRDYLRRIVRYANVEKCCLLMILIFIDRICSKGTTFVVSSLTVHRVIIASIIVASKSLCDNYYTNTHYAKVGGVSLSELNTLELEILFLLDWQLATTADTLQQYYTNLLRNSLQQRQHHQQLLQQQQQQQQKQQQQQQQLQKQQQPSAGSQMAFPMDTSVGAITTGSELNVGPSAPLFVTQTPSTSVKSQPSSASNQASPMVSGIAAGHSTTAAAAAASALRLQGPVSIN